MIDPWGPERFDAAIARLAVLVESIGRSEPQLELSDFIPRPGPFDNLDGDDEQPVQTAEDQAALLQVMFARR